MHKVSVSLRSSLRIESATSLGGFNHPSANNTPLCLDAMEQINPLFQRRRLWVDAMEQINPPKNIEFKNPLPNSHKDPSVGGQNPELARLVPYLTGSRRRVQFLTRARITKTDAFSRRLIESVLCCNQNSQSHLVAFLWRPIHLKQDMVPLQTTQTKPDS